MNITLPDHANEYSLTPFQRKVLQAVMRIPLGETRTYQWVADQIGHPHAVRAVGTALRKNPFPLMIPCHRVVKSNGNFGKYAGQDNGDKEKLLKMEWMIKHHIEKGAVPFPEEH